MDTNQICELLSNKLPELEVLKNEPMKKHTSFKIGGDAEVFVKAKTIDEIKEIISICNENNIPLTIVGNGSNLLVNDEGIKGIVLKVCLDYINIDKTEVDVIVGSGVMLGKLAQILLKESISGFEFASGIPGTIGGAVRMNAGAYGTEFKDIVIETSAIDRSGKIVKFNNEEQNFTYRSSVFKNNECIIVEKRLKGKTEENQSAIKEKMDEYRNSRLENQPVEYPSAGSTFKRGEDFITAKLIDECGLKGYSIGGAKVSEKHAGFIVNTGNATAKDVLELAEFVKKKVFEKYGKEIELEIEVI